MTPSATISPAISTMHLEKSSGVSVARRNCGRECGITPLVCAKGGATLKVMKTTGQEVVFKRSENAPEKIQPHHLDFLCYSSVSKFSHQPAFFKATPFNKRFHFVHNPPQSWCNSVCVCVLCVDVSMYICVYTVLVQECVLVCVHEREYTRVCT